MQDKDKNYKLKKIKPSELPTILWVFGITNMSLILLLAPNLFAMNAFIRNILVTTAIILGSIGLSIFIVAVLYPMAQDLLTPKSKEQDNKPQASDYDEIL